MNQFLFHFPVKDAETESNTELIICDGLLCVCGCFFFFSVFDF